MKSFRKPLVVCAAMAVSIAGLTGCPATNTWENSYGTALPEQANDLVMGAFGRAILAGWQYDNATGQNGYLIQLNQAGALNWERVIGGAGDQVINAIARTPDGGFIMAGSTTGNAKQLLDDRDVYLVKTDQDGQVEWTQSFGVAGVDEIGLDVEVAFGGGFVIAGYQLPTTIPSPRDAFLIRTNTSGEEIWSKTYGGAVHDTASSVVTNADGGYTFTGYTTSQGAGANDVWLVKVDAVGDVNWSRTFGGNNEDYGMSVARFGAGYVIAGQTRSMGAGGTDAYLLRTDFKGDLVWENTFGGAANDSANSVKVLPDGFVFTGFTESSGAGAADAYLVRTGFNGEAKWERTFGGSDTDAGMAVVANEAGGFVVAGYTESMGEGASDVYAIRTNSGGQVLP